MLTYRTNILLVLILHFAATAFGQNPTRWSLDSDARGREVKSGEEVKVVLSASVEPGWHLYSVDQPAGGPIPTTIKVSDPSKFEIAGKIETPAPRSQPDPNFIVDGKPLETKYFTDRGEFRVNLKSLGDTPSDAIALDVRFQLCNDTFCLPPRTKRVSFAGEEDVKKSASSSELPASSSENSTPPASPVQSTANNQQPSDLWAFIWLAATLGALSLLTPCVFPMIPITVSYFTNHSAGSRSRSIRLATIYSLGIVATFTLLGMLLALFVGAAGINLFAANPWVNILIAAIFLFFAFNLFGAYEITVPTSVLTKLDSFTRSHEGGGAA